MKSLCPDKLPIVILFCLVEKDLKTKFDLAKQPFRSLSRDPTQASQVENKAVL